MGAPAASAITRPAAPEQQLADAAPNDWLAEGWERGQETGDGELEC